MQDTNGESVFITPFNLFYFFGFVPFRTYYRLEKDKYYLQTNVVQKVICALVYIVVAIYQVYYIFNSCRQFKSSSEVSIVALFDVVSNFAFFVSILLVMNLMWREQAGYLQFLEYIHCKQKSGKFAGSFRLLKAAKEEKQFGHAGDVYYDALITAVTVALVIFALHFLMSFVLAVGAWMKNEVCCWIWIVASVCGLAYGVISLIIQWSAPTKTDMKMPGAMAGGNIAMAIGYLITFYLIYVVFAFVMEMRNEKQQQRVDPVAGAYPVGVPSQPQPQMSTYYVAAADDQLNYPTQI